VLRRGGFGLEFSNAIPIPADEAIQVVAIGPVGAEGLFVEEAFDAAAQADLVGVILGANRPAHFAVPAPTEDYYSGTRQSCGQEAQRPQPTRSLFYFTHPPQPVSRSKS
jgi:hypothetical protein